MAFHSFLLKVSLLLRDLVRPLSQPREHQNPPFPAHLLSLQLPLKINTDAVYVVAKGVFLSKRSMRWKQKEQGRRSFVLILLVSREEVIYLLWGEMNHSLGVDS